MPFADNFSMTLPAGPIAVVGMHSGDARRSNRAGKTALLEAITWCLYGVHRKRLDDSLINRSVSLCQVEVALGDIAVRRSRARGESTKLVVTTPTAELTGEAAQNAVIAAIGLGLDDYLATSCVRQGDVEAIIARTSGERLAIVSEWLQLTRWNDAKKIQAAKASSADTRLGERRAALETAAAYLLQPSQRETVEAELKALRRSLDVFERDTEELTIRMMNSAAAKSQLAQHAELRELRAQAAELRTKLTKRATADRRTAEAEEQVTHAWEGAAATKRALSELAQVRRGGFDGVCPITCQECPVAEDVTKTVKSASALFAERTSADAAKRAEWERARVVLEAARRASSEFERFAAQYQQTLARGKQIAGELVMDEEQAAAAPSSQTLQLELDELRRRFSEAAQKAGEREQLLASADQHQFNHAKLIEEVAEAEEQSKVSRLALRAVSSVPARIAAQQLGELEQQANLLLQGSGVSLRFSWARELAEKAPACDECGFLYPTKRGDTCPACNAKRGRKLSQELELLCDDGSGVEEDARFNSGGTRAVIGSSIRLAASAMLRRLRSSRAAWAIVDEPFGSLDAQNREQLARTFAGMLSSVGLEQALVVSHDPALLAALPSRIVVDKDGGSSTLRIE